MLIISGVNVKTFKVADEIVAVQTFSFLNACCHVILPFFPSLDPLLSKHVHMHTHAVNQKNNDSQLHLHTQQLQYNEYQNSANLCTRNKKTHAFTHTSTHMHTRHQSTAPCCLCWANTSYVQKCKAQEQWGKESWHSIWIESCGVCIIWKHLQ